MRFRAAWPRIRQWIGLEHSAGPTYADQPSDHPLSFGELTDWLFTRAGNVFSPVKFVQVGAHDGVSGDPINQFVIADGWMGLVIEPVPHLFERLQQTYRDVPSVAYLNVCVGPTAGIQKFYRMKPIQPEPVEWYSQLSSLRKEVILTHASSVPGIEALIEETYIETKTLDGIIDEAGIRPDVLVIDTEGYDAKILASLDLSAHPPSIIYYEVVHLDAEEAAGAIRLLKGAAYIVLSDSFNAVAVRPSFLSGRRLRRVVAQLSPDVVRN